MLFVDATCEMAGEVPVVKVSSRVSGSERCLLEGLRVALSRHEPAYVKSEVEPESSDPQPSSPVSFWFTLARRVIATEPGSVSEYGYEMFEMIEELMGCIAARTREV